MDVTCKTNKLHVEIDVDKLLQKYVIVRFTTSEKYIRYEALVLDEVCIELKAKSIIFDHGKSFLALFDKNIVNQLDISFELQKLQDASALQFRRLNCADIEKLPLHKLAQLLINSVATPSHPRLSFNNLTGKLYLFESAHFQKIKEPDNEQLFKIVALEMKILEDLSLQLNVVTFSHVKLRNQMDFTQSKRKFHQLPQYTFIPATKTLRRVFKADTFGKDSKADLFVIRQTKNNGKAKKNTIQFLNFNSLEDFNQSKVGILNQALKSIKQQLSECLQLSFEEVSIKNTIRFSRPFSFDNFQHQISIIDHLDKEEDTEIIDNLRQSLQKVVPNASIKQLKKDSKKGFNIHLIHNKSFYEKYNIPDPYKPKTSRQYLTFEDFNINSTLLLKAIVKELAIKDDVNRLQINILDWSEYGYKYEWLFALKEQERYFFMSIAPNGTIAFEEFIPSLFNQGEFRDLCEIFDQNQQVECLIKDDKGNINYIEKTNSFTLPKYNEIYNILYKESQKIALSKTQAKQIIDNVFNDESKLSEILHRFEELNDTTWSKATLLNCFHNRNDKKLFVEKVEAETDEILKSYLRGNKKFELMDSQLDIHAYQCGEQLHYFVGTKNKGIRQYFTRASVIRKIIPFQDSQLIFDDLLPLMDVDFVKNGDLTVVPFPFKYLREWVVTKLI